MGKYQNDMYKYRYFGFSDVDCDIESKLSVGKHLAYSQYHNWWNIIWMYRPTTFCKGKIKLIVNFVLFIWSRGTDK